MSTPTLKDVFITTLRRVKNKEHLISYNQFPVTMQGLGHLFFLIFSTHDELLTASSVPKHSFNLMMRDFQTGKPTAEVKRDLGQALIYGKREKQDLVDFVDIVQRHLRDIRGDRDNADGWKLLTLWLEAYEALFEFTSIAASPEFANPTALLPVHRYRELVLQPRPKVRDVLVVEVVQIVNGFIGNGPNADRDHALSELKRYIGLLQSAKSDAVAERHRIKLFRATNKLKA